MSGKVIMQFWRLYAWSKCIWNVVSSQHWRLQVWSMYVWKRDYASSTTTDLINVICLERGITTLTFKCLVNVCLETCCRKSDDYTFSQHMSETWCGDNTFSHCMSGNVISPHWRPHLWSTQLWRLLFQQMYVWNAVAQLWRIHVWSCLESCNL